MKKLAIATVFAGSTLVGGSWAAHAADLALKTPVYKAPIYKAPVMAAYNWTGFYAGVNAGFGFGRDLTTLSEATSPFNSTRISPLGAIGGGQMGYNWQIGNFGLGNIVLGLETDIQGAGLTSHQPCTTLGFSPCSLLGQSPAFGTQYSQTLDWFGTARGRIGIATGPVLSYFTGGFAYGGVKTGFNDFAGGVTSFSETRTGWTIGSGVEAALGGNWTGKIEYLYLDLGTQNGLGANPGDPTSSFSSDIREHIFRVGLNYRIGGQGAYAPEPLRDWSGLYIGGNGGSATARNASALDFTNDGPIGQDRSFLSPDGYFGGAQIGYNWQAANWVLGFETDIQASTQRDNNKVCLPVCTPTSAVSFDQKMSWFGTVRARLGYSIGSSLFYATGGLAYGDVKTTINNSDTADNFFFSQTITHTKTGWTVGAGVETPFEFFNLFGKNWTSKTEYLYVDLGSTKDPVSVFGDSNTAFSTHVQEHIFRSGLNYHFNAPVTARY
jgi:outer membrane immunogenic protein